MLGRPAVQIELSVAEHEALLRIPARRKPAQDLALRARIILAFGEGLNGKQVCARLKVSAKTASK